MKISIKSHLIEFWRAVLITTTFALSSSILIAVDGPPTLINYQGYLVDSSGNALGSKLETINGTVVRVSSPANYKVQFKIYDKQSGEAEYADPWSEIQVVTVDNGYFNIYLGEVTEIPIKVFSGTTADERFVGITVDLNADENFTESEIAPRLRLLSSPYSFLAQRAIEADKISSSGKPVLTVNGSNAILNKTVTITPESGKNALELKPGSGASYTGTISLNDTGLDINHNGANRNLTLGANGNKSLILQKDGKVRFLNSLYTSQEALPNITLDSMGSGDEWNNQGSYVRIGEGASSTASTAAMNMTYKGNGWGYTGAGKITGYNKGVPTGGFWGYDYNSETIYTNGKIGIGLSDPNDAIHIKNKGGLTIQNTDATESAISLMGSGLQGTGRLFVGQTKDYGGGIIYNGDGTPAFAGSTPDRISFYRTDNGAHHEVFNYSYANNDVTFNNRIIVKNIVEAPSIQAQYFYAQDDSSMYFTVKKAHDDGVAITNKKHNNGSIGTSSIRWDDGYITELWASVQGSDRRIKKDITPVRKNELLEMIDEMSFYQYRLRFSRDDKMKRQGRDADGFFYGIMAQELRGIYPNVVKSSGLAVELDENEEDEEEIQANHWYVEKDRLAELALGGVKDLYAISKEKNEEIVSLKSRNYELAEKVDVLAKRISKLEELMGKINQGE